MDQSSAQPPVLVRNVRVFDGVSDRLSDVRAVYLEDGLIAEEPERLDPGAVVVDGGGRVLMPGLTDAHVHLFAAGATMPEMLFAPTGVLYYKALAEAQQMLMRGFTTVRDMGGDTTCLRQVFDAGLFPGPRIYPARPRSHRRADTGTSPTSTRPPPSSAEFRRVRRRCRSCASSTARTGS